MDFSIIIPAKNEESNIGRCLQSISESDCRDLEIEVLVIDNGSGDRTVEIATGLGAVVYVRPNATISSLRNFGASKSTGSILVFIDADCSVTRDWLQQARHYLSAEGIACFGSPPGIPNPASWVQKAWFSVRGRPHALGDVEWLESMNMFVPNDVFTEVGGFNESLVTCEDYDFSLRLRKLGRLVSDYRIGVVHHGEAATLRQFFKKERWRGKGNIQGAINHGFYWRELPSLVSPFVYALFLLITATLLLLSTTGGNSLFPQMFALLVVAWQCPILFVAFRKARGEGAILSMQILLLLNFFLCARALSQIDFFRNNCPSRKG